MSFANLKRNRKKSLQTLVEESQKQSAGSYSSDERFWQPVVDKAGNGTAVIRFLPAPEGSDVPWVRQFAHGFKGPGGWFINDCLTTIEKNCPVCENNNTLWNSGIKSDRDIVSGTGKDNPGRKRKLTYISNILVVKDPANPDNNGKVFLYRYGKKIYDKLNDAMNPEFDDQVGINPFDLWEGANFRLRIAQVDGYRNYDKSTFDAISSISDDDDEILKKIYESEYSLADFLNPEKFTSYEEQTARLSRVIGTLAPSGPVAQPDEGATASEEPTGPIVEETAAEVAESDSPPWDADGEEDDNINYFEKLANDD